MPTICRLLQLPPDDAAALPSQPGTLTQSVDSAKIYSDVYRYWHAIQYLLVHHRPGSPQINWLDLGQAVSAGTEARSSGIVDGLVKTIQSTFSLARISPMSPDCALTVR